LLEKLGDLMSADPLGGLDGKGGRGISVVAGHTLGDLGGGRGIAARIDGGGVRHGGRDRAESVDSEYEVVSTLIGGGPLGERGDSGFVGGILLNQVAGKRVGEAGLVEAVELGHGGGERPGRCVQPRQRRFETAGDFVAY
jgi:hypothetical protein